MVSRQNMRRRMLHELHWHTSAVGLLQRVDKAAVAVIEILVNNFDLTLQLNVLAWVALQLSGGSLGIAVVGCSGIVRKRECAAEEHEAGENRTAEDPRGTDLELHGGTFLTAMIATRRELSEITGGQSQKDISEVLGLWYYSRSTQY